MGVQDEDEIDRKGMATSLFLCLLVGSRRFSVDIEQMRRTPDKKECAN